MEYSRGGGDGNLLSPLHPQHTAPVPRVGKVETSGWQHNRGKRQKRKKNNNNVYCNMPFGAAETSSKCFSHWAREQLSVINTNGVIGAGIFRTSAFFILMIGD